MVVLGEEMYVQKPGVNLLDGWSLQARVAAGRDSPKSAECRTNHINDQLEWLRQSVDGLGGMVGMDQARVSTPMDKQIAQMN